MRRGGRLRAGGRRRHAPPQAETDPFHGEIAPPSAKEDEEEDQDQGQADEGCLFMERPLELIV